jgi:arsenate reductase
MCTHNSARSQMAEGWLRSLLGKTSVASEILSAGTEKTRVKPEAIQVMAEIGIDLASHRSKTLEEIEASDSLDAVITVCDSAYQSCPYFPGSTRRYHISLPDPSGHDMERWRQSRDQVGRVMAVLVEHLAQDLWPPPEALNAAAKQQGETHANSTDL